MNYALKQFQEQKSIYGNMFFQEINKVLSSNVSDPFIYFIVDFFAQEIGLIIEIDGNSHSNKGDYDKMRQNKLEALGYTILRFSEGDVINNLGDVITQIQHVIYCLRETKHI